MIAKIQQLIPKLVFSVLITTIIVTTFSFSKYESTMAGSTNVAVASFIIGGNGQTIEKLSLDCNNENPSVSYDLIVTNKKDNYISQVTTKYDIVVEFSGQLPLGITISDGTTTLMSEEGKTTYTFSDVGVLYVGAEQNNNHTITLTGSNEVLSAYTGTVSFYVDAIQID